MVNTLKLLPALCLFCFFVGCQKESEDESEPTSQEELRASVKEQLWAYYPFNGNLNDVSGNNRPITASNIAFSQDTWGNENATLEFNGLNSSAIIEAGKGFPEGDFSITFFMMPKKISGALFEKANFQNGTGASFSLLLAETNSKGKLVYATSKGDVACNAPVSLADNNVLENEKTLNPDAWYHVAIVSKSGSLKTYINAYNINTATFTNSSTRHCADASFRLGISAMENMSPFMGKIDNLRIFTKALTDLEVEHLFWGQY